MSNLREVENDGEIVKAENKNRCFIRTGYVPVISEIATSQVKKG